jgi:ganglioside-induced differentiation-associated protein 1
MLKLYKFGNSICTQKVFILLDDKKIDYEPINVDLFKNEQYNPTYLKLNPKGVVPTLIHDANVVVESTLICEYLDEVYPNPSFTPKNPYQKSQMRLWSKMVDEALFAATRELSFSAMFREKLKNMTDEQRETRFKNVGDPDRRARYVSCFEHGVDSPYVLQGIAAFEKAFKTMEFDLASAGPWLLGRDISLADINMMPFVARLAYLNLLDIWLEERPHVADWWRRVQEYPSFKSQIRLHVSDSEMAEMQTTGTKIRRQVAERRREYLNDFKIIMK